MLRSAAILLLTFLTGCALTPRDVAHRSDSDALLEAQIAAARSVASRNVPLVFVGVAMHSQSTAFEADVRTTQKALARLVSAPFPSIVLSNDFETKQLSFPFATTDSIPRALQAASEIGDATTPVVVLLSTHGTRGALSLAIGFTEYPLIREEQLARWLAPLGDRPVILIISACHAGSLVPALGGAHRAIFYAAAADRASFGCDVKSTNTFFIEELFGRHLHPDASLSDLMGDAQRRIAAREAKSKLKPSMPDSAVGIDAMPWVKRPLREW